MTLTTKQEAYIEAWNQRNDFKKRQLFIQLLNQVLFLEGKKGKGKTISAVAITRTMRDLYDRPVVIVGSKMGLTPEYGNYTYIDEKQFINELDSIATISKSTEEAVVQSAVEAALKSLGVNIYESIIVFDEAYKLFDSRSPSDKLVKVFGYFVAQSRHYGLTILVIAPNRDMIDKRVRRQMDWFGRCSTTCKSLPNAITGEMECIRYKCPHRTVVRFVGGVTRFKFTLYGPDYWGMYNTLSLVGFRESHLRINI